MKYTTTSNEKDFGERIDKFLTNFFIDIRPEINRSKIQFLIESGFVKTNNKIITQSSYKVKENESYDIEINLVDETDIKATKIDFEIIFEDEDVIVINKPANLTVHPGSGNSENTLVNGLIYSHKDKLSTIGGNLRPGIVHRLDKDTSGLMLIAKNDLTHQILSRDLSLRKINRNYLAFVYGVIKPAHGIITTNITRNEKNRLKMRVSNNMGRNAVTHYKTLKTYPDDFISLVECRLETGRTHQIRVHMEYLKHSIVGDQTYNSCQKYLKKDNLELTNFLSNLKRQALHSYKINFNHPTKNKLLEFETKLPDDLLKLDEILLKNE